MIEIHGHRGFRGKWPENTVTGFLKAMEAGATAIELDVVMSADKQIVVSHEPWMSHKICRDKTGKEIPQTAEKSHSIFGMPYSEICLYDCGSQQHPDFPDQVTAKEIKPLLSEVIQAAEAKNAGRASEIIYNIEVKSSPLEAGEFYPAPEEFVELLLEQLAAFCLPPERILLQSFDLRILRELKDKAPETVIGLLVEAGESPENKLSELGFRPGYMNPHFSLVTAEVVTFCTSENIKILPWTVNEKEEMLRLLTLGVSGLITDFPDRAVEAVKNFCTKA